MEGEIARMWAEIVKIDENSLENYLAENGGR